MGDAIRGRGSSSRIQGRFESDLRETNLEHLEAQRFDEEPPAPKTIVKFHESKSIISRNDSPDVPFEQSINPYLGCEHGCSYCFARPSHAYLGLSPGIDFETKIFAKRDARALLQKELDAKSYVCKPITLGANTDPYQPIERSLEITRQIIQVLSDLSHPMSIVTKNALVERDIDLLAPMARKNLVSISISVTTLENELSRKLEPRASAPLRRIDAIRRLSEAGIPVNVLVAPIIPFLTDCFMEQILQLAFDAGVRSAGYVLIRLPHEVAPVFRDWLLTHYPKKAAHILSLIHQMRGGKDYDSRWGIRQSGEGEFARLLESRFRIAKTKLGGDREVPALDRSRFVRPSDLAQPSLF